MNRPTIDNDSQTRCAQTTSAYYRHLISASRGEERGGVIESFHELMKCFMCFGRVRDPVLCPSCSKFACEPCLRSWITDRKAECPVCRRPLALSQIVRVRFLADFSKAIDVLGRSQLAADAEADRCADHDAALGYYCFTCARAVCGDCVVMTRLHDGHALERIRVVYEQRVKALCAELAAVGRRAAEQRAYARELAGKLGQLQRAKEEQFDELMSSYRLMKARLEADFEARSQKVVEERQRVEKVAAGVEAAAADVCSQLRSAGVAQTIARADEHLRALAELGLRPFAPGIPRNIVGEFGSEVAVRPTESVFVLEDYTRRRAANEIVFSDLLLVDGVAWRVKVYPNGTGIYKGTYLSLFVEMVRGWEGGGVFHYRVALVHPNSEGERVERDYTSDFENTVCWGYNRFCKLEDIEEQGFLDRERDRITLRWAVRAASHFQKIRDQSNYIRQLEEQLRREREASGQREHSADASTLDLHLLFPKEECEREEDCAAQCRAPNAEESPENSIIKISDVTDEADTPNNN